MVPAGHACIGRPHPDRAPRRAGCVGSRPNLVGPSHLPLESELTRFSSHWTQGAFGRPLATRFGAIPGDRRPRPRPSCRTMFDDQGGELPGLTKPQAPMPGHGRGPMPPFADRARESFAAGREAPLQGDPGGRPENTSLPWRIPRSAAGEAGNWPASPPGWRSIARVRWAGGLSVPGPDPSYMKALCFRPTPAHRCAHQVAPGPVRLVHNDLRAQNNRKRPIQGICQMGPPVYRLNSFRTRCRSFCINGVICGERS